MLMNGTRRIKWCWKEEFPTKKMFTLLGNMAEVGHRRILQISLTERQILNYPRWFKGGLKGNLETLETGMPSSGPGCPLPGQYLRKLKMAKLLLLRREAASAPLMI